MVNCIKKSFSKIFLSTIIYVVSVMAVNFLLSYLCVGFVNLHVRGFFSFSYPEAMPNPENYTYVDEGFQLFLFLLITVYNAGFLRFCLKRLNGDECRFKDVFMFFIRIKYCIGALISNGLPVVVFSIISFTFSIAMIFDLFSVTGFLAEGIISMVVSISLMVLCVFLWMAQYIYAANYENGLGYAMATSFSYGQKHFWKLLAIIVMYEVIEYLLVMFVGSNSVLIQLIIDICVMFVNIVIGKYILDREQFSDADLQEKID